MKDVNVEFSKKELSNFLSDLSKQIEHGKVGIHLPGKSEGAIRIAPKKPITLKFDHLDDEERLDITIELEESRKEIES